MVCIAVIVTSADASFQSTPNLIHHIFLVRTLSLTYIQITTAIYALAKS